MHKKQCVGLAYSLRYKVLQMHHTILFIIALCAEFNGIDLICIQ